MAEKSRSRRGCAVGMFILAAVIAFAPCQTIIWDGGFPDIETQLTFVDADGKPVPNVRLRVFTKGGAESPFYPVDEFVPDKPLVSDADGRMVFHHSSNGLEFGGRDYHSLLGIGTTEHAPHYDCVFTLDGREVFRTPFNFHHREWDEFHRPKVTREWFAPWDVEKHEPLPDESHTDWEKRHFGNKLRADMDREERTAAGNFERRFFRNERRERTFIVVERTIAISTR